MWDGNWGTVTSTMHRAARPSRRARCGAGAGCSAGRMMADQMQVAAWRFEGFSSHRSRFACECNNEEFSGNWGEGLDLVLKVQNLQEKCEKKGADIIQDELGLLF